MKNKMVLRKNELVCFTNKILTKFNNSLIWMMDETYVKMDLKQLPGPKFYVAASRGDASLKFKYTKMDKFGKKTIIWQ